MGPIKDWLQKMFIGIFAVIIGAFIFFQTANFAMFLVIALGIFAVLNGFFILFTGIKAPFEKSAKAVIIARGAVSLTVGLCAVFLPMLFLKITWFTMLYVIGFQLFITGVLGIINAVEMKRYHMPVISRIVEAVISIALALLIIFMPQEIGETLLKVLGVFVVGFGIVMIVKGLSLRKDSDHDYYRSAQPFNHN